MEELLPVATKDKPGLLSTDLYKWANKSIEKTNPFCLKFSLQQNELSFVKIDGQYNSGLINLLMSARNEGAVLLNDAVSIKGKIQIFKLYKKDTEIILLFNIGNNQTIKCTVCTDVEYEIISDVSFIDGTYEEQSIRVI